MESGGKQHCEVEEVGTLSAGRRLSQEVWMVVHGGSVEDGEGKHGEESDDGQDWECGVVSDVVSENESNGEVVWKLE